MLDKNLAIEIETKMREDAGPRYTYIFKCNFDDCQKKIKIRSDALKTATGYCKVHAQRKRPYESIYEGLRNDHRKIPVEITYDEYLEYTKINNCHYCFSKINREAYSIVDGEYKSRAYYLDRKNNALGYSKDNCVVCCTKCNKARANNYTYEEWFGMTEYFRKVANNGT